MVDAIGMCRERKEASNQGRWLPSVSYEPARVRRRARPAGFGKRIEYWVMGRMLKAGLDVYVPMVDDNAIDAVVRRPSGTFVEVQMKARSRHVVEGDAALFAAIPHELRRNPLVRVLRGTHGDDLDHELEGVYC